MDRLNLDVLVINDVGRRLDAHVIHHDLLLVDHGSDGAGYLDPALVDSERFLGPCVQIEDLLLNALIVLLLLGFERVEALNLALVAHLLDSLPHLVQLILLKLLLNLFLGELLFLLELLGLQLPSLGCLDLVLLVLGLGRSIDEILGNEILVILLNLLEALLHELLAPVNGIIHVVQVHLVSLPLLVVHAEEHRLHGLLDV